MTEKMKLVLAARKAGALAFKAGLKAVPAQDAAFVATLQGRCEFVNDRLDGWLTGWHTANLAEPVFLPDGTRVDTWKA